jgi:hypothetical protein
MEWLGTVDRRYPACYSELGTPLPPPPYVATPRLMGRDGVWKW